MLITEVREDYRSARWDVAEETLPRFGDPIVPTPLHDMRDRFDGPRVAVTTLFGQVDPYRNYRYVRGHRGAASFVSLFPVGRALTRRTDADW